MSRYNQAPHLTQDTSNLSIQLYRLARMQSELHRPIPRNSVESNHGCSFRIYFDNADDNVKLTLYIVKLR